MENVDIKYKIIEINVEKHSMIVRYFTDEFDEDRLATSFTFDDSGKEIINRREDGAPIRCETDTNITIWKTPTPNISELQLLASSYAPRDWFKLKSAISNNSIDTSLSELETIKNQTLIASIPVVPENQQIDFSPNMSYEEIEKLIASLSDDKSVANT